MIAEALHLRLGDPFRRVWLRALSRPRVSRVAASLADRRPPGALLRPLMRLYVRAYGVDLAEAAQPLESYPSFNAFFTRHLREGARPLDPDPLAVLSPCDARVNTIGPVPADGRLEQIKGRTYALDALLGGPEAEEFAHGTQATLYLSPAMYHRVHAPVSGTLRSWRYLPGKLYPVNELAVRMVDGLFVLNERVVMVIDSPQFGPVAVVMVGATNVGRITLAFDSLTTNAGLPATAVRPAVPHPIARGEELGAFNLGSTVVLHTARSAVREGVAPGGLVKMGPALWRAGAQ